MEICPKCKDYSLSYDPRRKTARCYSLTCRFEEPVINSSDYFDRYVISPLNWENFCAQTPLFVREIRGIKEPRRVSAG
jgi:hypothetical protein